MQKFLMGFLGLLFIPGMAQSSLASDTTPMSNFTYWVRIPSTAQTCDQEAVDLGKRFADGTKLEVVSSVCRGTVTGSFRTETDTLYSILVTYRAQYPVSAYQVSMEPGSLAPMYMSPAYATYAECKADLAAQAASFTTYTQLVAVSASCDLARASLNGFTAKIEGFGEPKMREYGFMLNLSGDMSASMMAAGRDFLTSSGAQIVRTVDKTFYYYSASPIAIRAQSLGSFKSMDACKSEMAAASDVLVNSGSKRNTVECLPYFGGGSMATISEGYSYLGTSFSAAPKYFSLEECQGDRARILGDLRSGGRDAYIFGAICHDSLMEDNRFDMDVYVKGY